MDKPFDFRAHRLNVVHQPDLFRENIGIVENDAQILSLIESSTNSQHDLIIEGRENIYKWAIRDAELIDVTDKARVLSFKIVRSIVREPSDVLTDENVSHGYVDYDPPKAVSCTCLLYFNRHAVAVEYASALMSSEAWRKNFSSIVASAARSLRIGSTLELEPIPSEREILETFRSYRKLTRMRVYLRIPNPELSQHARKLYSEMKEGGVREYLQDMKNPTGLSKEEASLPYAAADIAQNGYKKGDVKFEGIRGHRFEKISTGSKAARGSISGVKEFVRGLSANAKSKEAAKVLEAVASELERVAPPPLDSDEDS